MPTFLEEYVDVLRREITPLESPELTQDITDEQLLPWLVDGFWEARLDGLLKGWTADESGEVVSETGPEEDELPREQVALVVLYAGIRAIRNRILNTNTSFRASAGPTEFEVQNSATMLVEMLKQLRTVKDRVLAEVSTYGTSVSLIDGYTVRQLSPGAYGGFLNSLYAEIGT